MRDGNIFILSNRWFIKVTGEPGYEITTIFQTDNGTTGGKVVQEIRLEKSDTNDLFSYLLEHNCVHMAAESLEAQGDSGLEPSDEGQDVVVSDEHTPISTDDTIKPKQPAPAAPKAKKVGSTASKKAKK